jgi:hypothetical protein
MAALLKRSILFALACAAPLSAQQPSAGSAFEQQIREPEGFRFCLDNTSSSGVDWSKVRASRITALPDTTGGVEAVASFDRGTSSIFKLTDASTPQCQGQMVFYADADEARSTRAGLLSFMRGLYQEVNVEGIPEGSGAFLDQKSSNVIIVTDFREEEKSYGRELKFAFFITPTKQ